MESFGRTRSSGSGRVALGLSTMTMAMLTAASAGIAAAPDEPGSQRSATGQAHSRAVAGPPAVTRAAPRKKGSGAPQGSGSARTTGKSSGKGANATGPYDPNGVGLPSGNGRSDSNNGKRPCAGCVGKADTKNPPGQLPGGSDSNRGYECDQNQGIGQTNPAHSRCSPTAGAAGPRGLPGASGGQSVAVAAISPRSLAGMPALVPTGAVRGASAEGEPGKSAAPESAEADPGNGPDDPASDVVSASPAPTARELAFTGLGLVWMALLGLAFTAAGRALPRRAAPEEAEVRGST